MSETPKDPEIKLLEAPKEPVKASGSYGNNGGAGGRPTLYKPEYCQMLTDFFGVEPLVTKKKKKKSYGKTVTIEIEESAELPMFIDFASLIGVDYDTLLEWRDKYPEFSGAYKKAKKLQEKIIAMNAIKGRYDKTFSIFMLKANHGWSENPSQQSDGPISIEIADDESGL